MLMWRHLMASYDRSLTPRACVVLFFAFVCCRYALRLHSADAQVWDNVGESFYALQTTARGSQVMLKYRCIVEDGRLAQPPCGEGAMPPLLEAFSKTAAGIPAMM